MEKVAKAPPLPKPTDRMMEALSTLAALLDRTINEVKILDADFQKRITRAIQEKEESRKAEEAQNLESVRQELREELTTRFQTELQAALDTLGADFQNERDRMRSEFDGERERLVKELQQAEDSAAELQAERSRLNAELKRVTDDSAAEIERMRVSADDALADAVAAMTPAPSAPQDELTRAQAKLDAVIAVIEDPATELSVVIRKNVEKLELEAYLKGLRYAINGE
jgi:hypothetical protein